MVTAGPYEYPEPLPRFGFFAIVGTWMEADVIADTVGNALAQGVDRVFLLDNESPDDTVARAQAAGAEHVMTYRTERFEERYRYNLMNEFVRYTSETSDYEHIWWLWLDADEFPRPQDGRNLREKLTSLDRAYRVVGARVLNHYPTPGATAYVPGIHPADTQPLAEEVPQNICRSGHRKHPLQRWDRHGPFIRSGFGFHRAECEVRPLYEPPEPIVIHHVPFRDEQASRARLAMLWSAGDGSSRAIEDDESSNHMQARRESVDAVYAGEWSRVHNFLPGQPEQGVHPVDWRTLQPSISTRLPSW